MKEFNVDDLAGLSDPVDFGSGSSVVDDMVRTMEIAITDVKPFKYNPRVAKNESYEELKASIAIHGIRQAPKVMRNPRNMDYELFDGGHSRLEAITELYRETGDEKYFISTFIVHPWIDDDAEKIIACLEENDLRGKLYHVDRARTIALLETIFRQEIDGKDSAPGAESFGTSRADNYGKTGNFIKYLQDKNYNVADQTLSTCRFTNNYLIGNIDYHLNKGLGSKKVAQIRLVYNNLKRYIKEKDLSDFKVNEFDELFKKSISRYNNYKQDFDYHNFVSVVAGELLANYPFDELFVDDESLIKVMIAKKPKPPKKPKQKTEVENEESDNSDFSEVENQDENNEVGSNDKDHNNAASENIDETGNENLDEDESGYDATELIPESGSSSTASNLADDFLAEQGFDKNGNEKTDAVSEGSSSDKGLNIGAVVDSNIDDLRKQAFTIAVNLIDNLNAGVIIESTTLGAGFLVKDIADGNDINTWCLGYLLLDYSLATDPSNPATNINIDGSGDNSKVIGDIYAASSKDWEDKFFDLIDGSGLTTPLPSFIGSFKRSISKPNWQKLAELEFISYQIFNQAISEELELWS
jgi:ParB family protein of integrating conjugative element (PFGI_1 class)